MVNMLVLLIFDWTNGGKDYLMNYIIIFLLCSVCFLFGWSAHTYASNRDFDGELLVNETNPEKETITVIFYDSNISDICSRKDIHLNVIHEKD